MSQLLFHPPQVPQKQFTLLGEDAVPGLCHDEKTMGVVEKGEGLFFMIRTLIIV